MKPPTRLGHNLLEIHELMALYSYSGGKHPRFVGEFNIHVLLGQKLGKILVVHMFPEHPTSRLKSQKL